MRPTIHLTLSPDVVKVGREEAAYHNVSLSRLVEFLIQDARDNRIARRGSTAPKESKL